MPTGMGGTKIEFRSHRPANAICLAPIKDNEFITDISVINIVDIQPTIEREIQAVDGNGDPIFQTLQKPKYDLDGNPILDGNGDPVMKSYQAPVYELDGNGDPVTETVNFGDSYKDAQWDAAKQATADAADAANVAARDVIDGKRQVRIDYLRDKLDNFGDLTAAQRNALLKKLLRTTLIMLSNIGEE